MVVRRLFDIKLFEPSTRSRDRVNVKSFTCRKQANKSYYVNSTHTKRPHCEICYQQGTIKQSSFGHL